MKKFRLIVLLVTGSLCFTELLAAMPPRTYSNSSQTAPTQNSDTVFLSNKPGYMVVGDRLVKVPPKPRHIDWRPQQQDVRRFTLAVSPLYVVNNGIRLDYEHELPSNTSWMQYHLMVCGRSWYGGSKDYVPYNIYGEGWSSMISSQEAFSKMLGIGAGIAYKRMISPLGWYYSFGGVFSYYNVWFYESLYNYSDNSSKTVLMNNQYYKLAANFNFGKHFALTDHLFLDFYAGLGLMGYISDPDLRYAEVNYDKFWGMYAFEYSGLYVNGGIRIGWLWSRPR